MIATIISLVLIAGISIFLVVRIAKNIEHKRREERQIGTYRISKISNEYFARIRTEHGWEVISTDAHHTSSLKQAMQSEAGYGHKTEEDAGKTIEAHTLLLRSQEAA